MLNSGTLAATLWPVYCTFLFAIQKHRSQNIYTAIIVCVVLCGCETWLHIDGKAWAEGGLCPQNNVPTECPPLPKVYSHYMYNEQCCLFQLIKYWEAFLPEAKAIA
jgi:hypothetical protein